ncbi:dipeptidyl-peptidase-4 [Lutibacter sp. Hel_I_33_5]|uniref:S9 family peptidase n=1 Tax=Lutibacter sp. Hel_I_33_5 TaxID=1566289 RepID=UPI0011A29570|nr:S9 family peptidase [Lutibacter sp. Hel_I_33_5]TVZ55832.1 dipeptidyl-peptidase-4 [Lutibacter sp. Hel_I_33_5]
MKKLFILFLGISTFVNAQKKDITLEDIWKKGTFRAEYMNSLNSMNGDYYSLLNYANGSSSVDKYSYKTLEKVNTIVDSKDFEDIKYFESYTFNNDETKLILGVDFKPIFRHSFLGTFYTYDIATKSTQLIGKDIQRPTFSPDSKKVAFAKDNNLFVTDFTTNTTYQITKDGKKNEIINGITDWVYEEEFAFVRAFEWSKDSKHIAFLRFDESKVKTFSMDVYGTGKYPTQEVFKYPKAGEDNAIVTLHMFTLSNKNTRKVDVGEYEYIPRINWTKDNHTLSVRTLNRHQNDLKLFFVDSNSLEKTLILNETDKAYVDVTDDLTFLNDNSFIWTSEKDGYNHIYHYNKSGKLINQITKGNWEVTSYYGFDANKKTIYYQSVENGSINRGVYSISLKGKKKKLLSNASGNNRASFSKNRHFFINTFSDANTPPVYTLRNNKGNILKTIKDNANLKELISNYNLSKKEFSTIKINGYDLNMYTIKPSNFDSSKKYPVLMYQYSGPGSQSVSNRWNGSNDYWHQMLAQNGYIIVCVDGRGTGLKGRDFKKLTYMNLVKLETEDQIAVAKEFAKKPYVDADKIGIWGWSFGGHMSTNSLLKGNDVFSAAIAVAPVTTWRFYDTIYTERYMRTPEENPAGYDDNSPINYPELLKGNYMLIHGTGDDNVHAQNAMRMAEALIQANKQFEWGMYPDKNHGIYGGNTRLHLYNKMTNFIYKNLGKKDKKQVHKIKG